MGVEEPESAHELLWNAEVEAEDVDITRMAQVADSKRMKQRKKREKREGCGIRQKERIDIQRGKSRLWSGWEAPKNKIQITHGGGWCVIDGQVDTG